MMTQTHRVIFPSSLSHTHKLKDTFQKLLSSPDEKEKEEKGGSMSFFMCRWFKNPDVCEEIGSPQGSFGVSGTRCAVRGGRGVGFEGGEGESSHHDMAAAVQGKVVGPREGAIALSAAERFDPRVLAEVSGELVGAGEAPGAALPGTVVGFLSCVYPPVSFEVGALGVNFFTAFIVTHVDSSPLDIRRVWINRLQVYHRPCIDTLGTKGGRSRLCATFCITVTLILHRRR